MEIQKRIGFKTSIKKTWTFSYWYPCKGFASMAYELERFLAELNKINTTELYIKIERREK